MNVRFNQFSQSKYPYLDDTYIDTYIPVAYGKNAAIKLTPINTTYSSSNGSIVAQYRMPEGISDYGSVQVYSSDTWITGSVSSVDYDTGIISVSNGRDSSGSTRDCRLIDCYGYVFSGHSYPVDVLIHWFENYGGIIYNESNFDITNFEAELTNTNFQCDMCIYLDDYDPSDESDYAVNYFWKVVYRIASLGGKMFAMVDYNNDGKITARLKDFSRASSYTFASVDIKDTDEIEIKSSSDDDVYSEVLEKYYYNSSEDSYLSFTDNTYNNYVKRNYRQTRSYTDESLIVAKADALIRAANLSLQFKDIPLVSTVDIFSDETNNAFDIKLFDVITITLMPDNLNSSAREYAGERDCLVIGTTPHYDRKYTELQLEIIPDRTASTQQIAVQNESYSSVSRTNSSVGIVADAITDITTGSDESGVVGSPDAPSSITAVAGENGITLHMVLSGTGTNNTINIYRYEIKKTTAGAWEDATVVEGSDNTQTYLFDRETDGYPEIADFAEWTVRARVESVYAKTSGYIDPVSVNTSSYGTWVIPTPSIISNVLGRSCILTLGLSTSALEVYGDINYQLEINQPDLDGTNYYKPNLTADPYGDETNYKDGSGYVESDKTFNQTLPLTGQTDGTPIATTYKYRITAYNEAGSADAVIKTIVALASEAEINGELTIFDLSDGTHKCVLSYLGMRMYEEID